MTIDGKSLVILSALLGLWSCDDDDDDDQPLPTTNPGAALVGDLADPDPSHDAKKLSRVLGWPEGTTPTAPEGFAVSEFAGDLDNPRMVYELPNGDILAVESNTVGKGPQEENLDPGKAARRGTSANRITILRDGDKDGVAEFRNVLLEGLNQPFGVAYLNGLLYVANTDSVMTFPYELGQISIAVPGNKILDLPAGGYNNHWTRNLQVNADGSKIYISVGSASNIAEHGMTEETRRANILEINPDGSGERIVASGLRNPVGMSLSPESGELWTVVNERDLLGDDLVPDYLTSVQDGGFYGWPYSYFGANPDPRLAGQRPDLVASAIVPDVDLGAHTASLGLAFAGSNFPEPYRNGVFIGQHGSWNRSEFSGYKVVFVPFENGRPIGKPQDFLGGFIVNPENAEVYGRPMSVAALSDGTLLVADDSGDTIWAVKH